MFLFEAPGGWCASYQKAEENKYRVVCGMRGMDSSVIEDLHRFAASFNGYGIWSSKCSARATQRFSFNYIIQIVLPSSVGIRPAPQTPKHIRDLVLPAMQVVSPLACMLFLPPVTTPADLANINNSIIATLLKPMAAVIRDLSCLSTLPLRVMWRTENYHGCHGFRNTYYGSKSIWIKPYAAFTLPVLL